MMRAEIVRATLLDAPAVVGMIYESYEGNKEHLTEETKQLILRLTMEALADPKRFILIAKIAKHGKFQIAGMVVIGLSQHPIDGLIASGDYLFVKPKYRGSNIANDLLDFGESLAKGAGAVKAYTEARVELHELMFKRGWKVETVIMSKDLKAGEADGKGSK